MRNGFFIRIFTYLDLLDLKGHRNLSQKEMEEIKELDEKFTSIIEENSKKEESIWVAPEKIVQLSGTTMT